MGRGMLTDLYLLQTYFEEPAGLMYQDDLVRRYGWPAVREALAQGLLNRRPVCGGSKMRWICRLSDPSHMTGSV